MHRQLTSPILTPHLLITFALVGPPIGFIAAVIGATTFLNPPEGIKALVYGLHPLGLALIYAAGLAPALATAGLLVLRQDRPHPLSIMLAGATGFIVTLAYGLIATLTTPIPNPMLLVVALAAIGGLSAVVCLIMARHIPKILAPASSAR